MKHLRRPLLFLAGFVALTGGFVLRADFEGEAGARFRAQVSALEFSSFQTPSPKPSTLLFVGDIMLAREVGNVIARQGDVFYPFRLIADEIRNADFAFGNLENPVSNRGENQGSIYSFRADPQVVLSLAFAGFDALSLANNHLWDYGREALEDTVELLTINNIQVVGAGMNYEEANGQKTFTLPDGTTLALFGYTNLMPRSLEATDTKSGLSQFNVAFVTDRIRALRETALLEQSGRGVDLIVVSLHWGEEYVPAPSSEQREIAHALIDAGADLVIGHHPHVVQEVEEYRSSSSSKLQEGDPSYVHTGYIAYSLGNFIFDQNFSDETMEGLMLKVFIRDGNIETVQRIPVEINETFQPYQIGS